MITVTVCVGSSCHLKGAREVIECFDGLLKQHGLKGEVALKGANPTDIATLKRRSAKRQKSLEGPERMGCKVTYADRPLSGSRKHGHASVNDPALAEQSGKHD